MKKNEIFEVKFDIFCSYQAYGGRTDPVFCLTLIFSLIINYELIFYTSKNEINCVNNIKPKIDLNSRLPFFSPENHTI